MAEPGREFTSKEAADLLGLDYATVLRYAREIRSELSVRRERGRLVFSPSDIEILREHHRLPHRAGITLGQIAAELNVPPGRIKKLAAVLRPVLPRIAGDSFAPEAVEVFRKQLRRSVAKEETNEAREYWRSIAAVKVAACDLARISRELSSAFSRLRKNPPSVTAFIHTLPDEALALVGPVAAVVSPLRLTYWRASLPEAGLHGDGKSIEEAIVALQVAIVVAYRSDATAPRVRFVLGKLVREERRHFQRYPQLTHLSISQVADELGMPYERLHMLVAKLNKKLPFQMKGKKGGKRVFDWHGVEAIRRAIQEMGSFGTG